MNRIEFLDLKKQYRNIKKEIDHAIAEVVKNCDFILGKQVQSLEQDIANYCGVKYGVGLNSGTDALLAALKALKIKAGDEVITTAFSFIATAEIIISTGAKPVFVDINPQTFNIDTKKLKEKITKKTKAIIPVHLFGQPAEMDQIMKIAKKHHLFVIEDSAQALGARYKGRKVCTFGDVGCISFFPSKNLGAYGDGGMIVTNNKKIADYIRLWRVHGCQKKYYSDFVGVSSRLDTLQAAVLRVKLKYLNQWNYQRRKKAEIYDKLINHPNIIKPEVNNNHIFHQYTIRILKNREKFIRYLKAKGIPTVIYYPSPLHLQKSYKYLGNKKGDCPVAEKTCKEVVSLPVYPELNLNNQRRICRIINQYKNV